MKKSFIFYMGNTQSKEMSSNFLIKKNYNRSQFSYRQPYKIKIKPGAIQGEFGEKKFIKP